MDTFKFNNGKLICGITAIGANITSFAPFSVVSGVPITLQEFFAISEQSLSFYVTAALVGMSINYIFGTNWMYAAYVFWFDAPEDSPIN